MEDDGRRDDVRSLVELRGCFKVLKVGDFDIHPTGTLGASFLWCMWWK